MRSAWPQGLIKGKKKRSIPVENNWKINFPREKMLWRTHSQNVMYWTWRAEITMIRCFLNCCFPMLSFVWEEIRKHTAHIYIFIWTTALGCALMVCALHTKSKANICMALLALDYSRDVFDVTHADKNIKNIFCSNRRCQWTLRWLVCVTMHHAKSPLKLHGGPDWGANRFVANVSPNSRHSCRLADVCICCHLCNDFVFKLLTNNTICFWCAYTLTAPFQCCTCCPLYSKCISTAWT